MIVRKGFPFLKRINNALRNIVEGGLMSKWLYESKITLKKVTIPDYGDVEGFLDLDRIFGVFVLLGVGYLVSIFIFLLELTCRKIM